MRGLTVAVTGANRGFGRAVAADAAQAGANVLLLGRDVAALHALAGELPGAARVAHLDLTAQATIERALAGHIDVLVNNAGVPGPIGPSWEVGEADWWQTIEINVRGTALASHAVLPGMLARRAGRVVNIVSNAGVSVWPYVSGYSVSKAAVIQFTANLALELRGRGVTTFSYHPGLLDIGMSGDHIAAGRSTDPWHNQTRIWLRMQRKTPLCRALGTLRLLLDGTADPLSGGYLTADDDIDVLVKEKS